MAYKYVLCKLPSDISNIINEYIFDIEIKHEYVSLLNYVIKRNIHEINKIKENNGYLTFEKYKEYIDAVYKYNDYHKLKDFDYEKGYKKHIEVKKQSIYFYTIRCNTAHAIFMDYFTKYINTKNSKYTYVKSIVIIDLTFNTFKSILDSINKDYDKWLNNNCSNYNPNLNFIHPIKELVWKLQPNNTPSTRYNSWFNIPNFVYKAVKNQATL